MSTRCNIEIYDNGCSQVGCRLYHHSDGYPEFMRGKLERFLNKISDILHDQRLGYWWDAERVGALMVMLSAQDYKEPMLPTSCGVPFFQPCVDLHGDIEYVWRIYLHHYGSYTIECHPVEYTRISTYDRTQKVL